MSERRMRQRSVDEILTSNIPEVQEIRSRLWNALSEVVPGWNENRALRAAVFVRVLDALAPLKVDEVV